MSPTGRQRRDRTRDRDNDGARDQLASALQLLEDRRAPYRDLLGGIVRDVLERFPPPAAGSIVEIGAGFGELRSLLPPLSAGRPLTDRVIASDPSRTALRRLCERSPAARTFAARAEAVPIASGAAAAVLGLCVFDAIHADNRDSDAAREIARVLAPGDRFVHFLDMATLLETPFTKLAQAGLVPIPNVFADPLEHGTKDAIPTEETDASGESERDLWPLDILLIARDWLDGVVGHDAIDPHFRPYFALFSARNLDVRSATRAFQTLAGRTLDRERLAKSLAAAAHLAARAGLRPLEPVPFQSGRYLASVLEASFAGSDSFDIEHAAIVTRSAWGPRPVGSSVRYRSLCVGHQRVFDDWPRRFLDPSAAARVRSGTVADDEMLVELGVFVFVARRR